MVSAFNEQKYKLINELKDENVSVLRNKYILAFEQVDAFLTKVQNWLSAEGKTLSELVQKKVKGVSFTDLLCLYYLLKDVKQADLVNKSSHIYDITYGFFKNNIDNCLKRKEMLENVINYQNIIGFSKC